eukprot:gene1289-2493_t
MMPHNPKHTQPRNLFDKDTFFAYHPTTFHLVQVVIIILTITVVSVHGHGLKQSNADYLFKEIDRCTTIAVGGKAGVNGPMVTHTADCSDCDFRVNKVPAQEWPENSKRDTYEYKNNYPGTVAKDRGDTWQPMNLEGTPTQLKAWGERSTLTGQLPQVKHTYALIEAGYGIMNEHQVAIGESTCAAKFWAAPTSAGGKAQLEVRELSRLALERTRTAREAVSLMGSMAEKYGFYAADWSGGDSSKGEGGETLTVCDTQEAWVFHILADDTGASAVWVARRVPDDHVAAIANQFIIRDVIPDNENYLYSNNIWDVAERNGLWKKEDGLLDFLLTYAPMRAHSTYVTRRRWRVFKMVAPSLDLSPETDPYAMNYPFSVKVDKSISAADLMQIQRDHYEGTEFDLTKGIAAGPFGDPNRFDPYPTGDMTSKEVIQGSFERAISLFRTSYSIVAETRSHLPNLIGARVWLCQYAPATSSYTPLYVASSVIPKPYSRGSLFKFDSNVAFWNFALVGNYAARFYSYAIEDIKLLQRTLLETALVETQTAEIEALAIIGDESTLDDVVRVLTRVTINQGMATVNAWKEFFPTLVTKYHDGYRAEDLDQPAVHMQKLFYPKWWLELTGFFNSKAAVGPNTLVFAPNPFASTSSSNTMVMIMSVIICSAFSLFVGVHLGRKYGERRDYISINV